MSPVYIPEPISTAEAARRLGVSADTLREWWEVGWVLGGERRGRTGPGRKPRYYWDGKALRYIGPVQQRALPAPQAAEAELPVVIPPNPFRYRSSSTV